MYHVNLKSNFAKTLLLVLLGISAFSYAAPSGSDSYQIYLNNKLIMKQYVTQLTSTIMDLPMDEIKPSDVLVIYYSHCGVIGKGRNIVIKNEKNQVLKEWKFSDAKGTDVNSSDAAITIHVKELIDLKKNNPYSSLNLYYSSREIPNGRMLASINPESKSNTKHINKSEPVNLFATTLVNMFFSII